jgi:hypothetical protein
MLPQAPSSGAPRIKPSAVRRVAPEDFAGPDPKSPDLKDPDLGSSGLTIAFLLSTGPNWPDLHRPMMGRGFRHIVDEQLTKTKGLWPGGVRAGCIPHSLPRRRTPPACRIVA